jgi:hypothetical protein
MTLLFVAQRDVTFRPTVALTAPAPAATPAPVHAPSATPSSAPVASAPTGGGGAGSLVLPEVRA